MAHRLYYLSLFVALIPITACEVGYKAANDAMYYGDRTFDTYEDLDEYWATRFGESRHLKNLKRHLYNYETFLCDGRRQFTANFDLTGEQVSLAFDGRNKLLVRKSPLMPYTDGIYNLFILEDGTLLVEKDKATLFRHCWPMIYDPLAAEPYDYTPTVSPEEFHSAAPIFEKRVVK